VYAHQQAAPRCTSTTASPDAPVALVRTRLSTRTWPCASSSNDAPIEPCDTPKLAMATVDAGRWRLRRAWAGVDD
jgi:hypothetical protein